MHVYTLSHAHCGGTFWGGSVSQARRRFASIARYAEKEKGCVCLDRATFATNGRSVDGGCGS